MLLVLTGADVAADKLGAMTAHLMPEDFGAPKGHRTFQPLLVADRVRYVGDRVAFVVAETLDAGARRRRTGRGRLRAAAGGGQSRGRRQARRARRSGTTTRHGNNAFRLMFGNQEATDAAFAKAKHVVKLRVENNRLSPVSMEPRVAIGDYDAADDFYTLYAASQNPHGAAHGAVAHLPCAGEPDPRGLARRRRRLRPEGRTVPRRSAGDVGVAQAAPPGEMGRDPQRKHARPTITAARWSITASWRSTSTARFSALRSKCAVPDGRVFRRRGARRRRVLDPLRAGGLRHPDHAHHVAGRVHQHLAERAVSRRRPPGGRLLHGAADRARRQRQIGIDRAEIRRRNLIPDSKLPYTTPTHWVYDSRRVRPPDGPVHGEQRLEGLRRAQDANRRRTASCAAAR